MTCSGPASRSHESCPPKISLVLGAGGVAGGVFHAGVLAAVEEAAG